MHHYSALEEVIRCLRAPLQAGLMEEGVPVEGEVLVLVSHRIFVGPQTQTTLYPRVRILVTLLGHSTPLRLINVGYTLMWTSCHPSPWRTEAAHKFGLLDLTTWRHRHFARAHSFRLDTSCAVILILHHQRHTLSLVGPLPHTVYHIPLLWIILYHGGWILRLHSVY